MSAPPGETAPGGRRALGPALLLALLALPFDPRWIDFEAARRGVLLAAAGVLALTAPRWLPARAPAGLLPLAGLCALHALRSIGAVNPAEGLLRAGSLTALAVVFWWGATRRPADVLRAVLPVGVLVAAFGTAQALGFDWPSGYARAAEPVATLGNRNAASEFATFALAAAAVLGLGGRAPAWASMVVVGLYVGLNGTRAGYVGAAVALGVAAAAPGAPRARRAGLALGVAALAVTAGALVRPGAPPAPLPAAVQTAAAAVPSTLEVRVELWSAGLRMVGDAPLAGHGSGQFRFEYPRYRSQREIELSTFGRRFPTFAENPHNDPLEIVVETGVLGAALLLAFVVQLARAVARGGRPRLLAAAPLGAFALATLVRSPLGNAPAAAAAALLAGALAARQGGAPTAGRRGLAGIPLGLALLALGLPVVGAASAAARWLGTGDAAWLDLAVGLHGSEPRYRSLRILARCGGVDDAGLPARRGPAEWSANREDLAALLRRDPNNTNALFLAAALAHGGGDVDAARATLGRLLTLDPREPRAQLLAALLLAQQGRAADAVATLYADPHPTLRARLAATLTAFAGLPELDADGRQLIEREARFVAAVDALADAPLAPAAQRAVLGFVGPAPADPRGKVLLARRLLAAGQTAEAAALAPPTLDLQPAVRELLAPVLEPLRELPTWAAALERR